MLNVVRSVTKALPEQFDIHSARFLPIVHHMQLSAAGYQRKLWITTRADALGSGIQDGAFGDTGSTAIWVNTSYRGGEPLVQELLAASLPVLMR